MDKMDVKREDIKYNFLKNIIVRFDYEGVAESELDSALKEISIYLKENDYISRQREISRKLDFEIEDPEKIENDGLPVKKVEEQIVYVFRNRNPRIKIVVSSSFAFVSIDKTKYINCLDYCGVLTHIIQTIASNAAFFRINRFGIRKINQCYIRSIEKINEYFEPQHYRLPIMGFSITPKVMELRDSFMIEDRHINLIRAVVGGEKDGKEAYQVNFDSDIYLLNTGFESLNITDTMIKEMNDILFEIYKSILTQHFMNALISSHFNLEGIEGIESNE